MLSSTSAASGTNLTKASKVILLDPVYGTYEFRKNTEWQAVGRAYRMGQTQSVEIVRLVIKDSVEEEIYKLNKIEDSKRTTQLKIEEINDESLTLSADKLLDIQKNAKLAKETKELKKKEAKDRKDKKIKDIKIVKVKKV